VSLPRQRIELQLARIVVVVAVAAATGDAAAASDRESPSLPEEPAPFARHRLGFDVGFASALGGIGVAYEFAALSTVWLEGGIGLGATGTQLSIMPKVAFGGPTCRFTAGLGASLALGGGTIVVAPGPSVIPWLNLDLPGVECRSRSGISFEAAIGFTMGLATFDYDALDTGGPFHAGDVWPQGRFGFGWWF
jgi:hypothetical protein